MKTVVAYVVTGVFLFVVLAMAGLTLWALMTG